MAVKRVLAQHDFHAMLLRPGLRRRFGLICRGFLADLLSTKKGIQCGSGAFRYFIFYFTKPGAHNNDGYCGRRQSNILSFSILLHHYTNSLRLFQSTQVNTHTVLLLHSEGKSALGFNSSIYISTLHPLLLLLFSNEWNKNSC